MVNIQGTDYPVVIVDDDLMTTTHKDNTIVGWWDYGTGIEVNERLQGDTKLPTLLHEIVHAMDDALNIMLSEHQTQLMAIGFLQLITANGGDVDWLRNMIDTVEE